MTAMKSQITIGVDGVAANDKERVGVSMYTFELLKYFQKQAGPDLRFVVYLKDKPRADMPPQTDFFRYRVVFGPFLWSRIFFPLALFFDKKPDVFFAPAHYLPPYFPGKAVVTIHDLAYEYYPDEFLKRDLYKLKNWTRSAVDKASKVIAVSENTKKDLIKIYKTPEDKIEVIYNGFRKIQETNNKKQTNFKSQFSNFKFILYVGTLQPRKNIITLIEAYQQLIIDGTHKLKLVIVGKKGWLYDKIFQTVKDLSLENKVIFTGYLPDDELAALYQNVAIFVMPSLYEGFCIPVLEAMSAGCPVIAAKTSSLPEVAGDACRYFDPRDKMDLVKQIREVLSNSKLSKDLGIKGLEQAKKFSWEKCGQETLELIKNMDPRSSRG